MTPKGWSLVAFAAIIVAGLADAASNSPPENWDGLTEVKSKSMDLAYLLPGADFRPYSKVMLDKTVVAFDKDWMKDMRDTRDLSRRIDDEDAAQIMAAAQAGFEEVFEKEFRKAGYAVVTAPGPDVLRVSTGVANLYINAPDVMAPGRSRSYTANAGEATLVLEVRDSRTNALLGRVVDRRETRDMVGQASRVTNTADFKSLFKQWAGICTKGLGNLKAISPIPSDLKPKQKLQ